MAFFRSAEKGPTLQNHINRSAFSPITGWHKSHYFTTQIISGECKQQTLLCSSREACPTFFTDLFW